MNNGWIKLHRQIIDNPIFRHDWTAWHTFETLLVIVDRKGSWSGGRIQLGRLVGKKDTTIYAAIKRLEKAKMVTLVSNNQFTTISICKWSEYQGNGDSANDNQMTTKSQPNDTLTRIRIKKEEKNNTRAINKKNPDVTKLIEEFESQIGSMPRKQYQALAASELIKQHGLERTLKAIGAAARARGQEYAPGIASLEDLRDKWVKLENFYLKQAPPMSAVKRLMMEQSNG